MVALSSFNQWSEVTSYTLGWVAAERIERMNQYKKI
jgi:hypothetical protein